MGRPQRWGQSLNSPILLHSRRAKQVELRKVHDSFIVDNPGNPMRSADWVCLRCAYCPRSILNSASFHCAMNNHLNNKLQGLSIYC